MTLKKLFATAASAALLAGGAHAATAALGDVTTDGAAAGGTSVAGLQALNCVANEADVSATVDKSIEVVITAAGTEFLLNSTQTLQIDLAGATFSGPPKLVARTADTITITGFNVTAGGTDGADNATAQFGVTQASAANDELLLEIPVTVASTSANVAATLSMVSNNSLNTLPSTTVTPVIFVDGINLTAGPAAAPLKISASDATQFVGNVDNTDIGLFTYTVPTYNAGTCAADAGGGAAHTTIDGATDITAAAYEIAGTITAATAQSATITTGFEARTFTALGTAFNNNGATGTVKVDLKTAKDAALLPTTLAMSATATATGLVDLTVASTAISPLEIDGDTLTYDWVGDTTAGRRNFFRCTGDFSSLEKVEGSVANGKDIATVAAVELAGITKSSDGLILFNNSAFSELGAFGNGDLTLNFIGADNTSCDRLMLGSGTNVATTFDNQNQ